MNDSDGPPGPTGLKGVLESPIVGMSPWIVFSLVVGPGRFEIAVALALACTVVLLAAGRLLNRGSSWKILEVSDLVFFAGLAVVGALAGQGTLRWLETYAGEVSNIALVVIAFGSMAVGMPFTLQYAREQVDPSHWHTPEFLRTNHVITGVWGLTFLVAAVSGAYGDIVLRDPNDLWTGWIIQILAIVAAIRFTDWYRRWSGPGSCGSAGSRSPRSPGSPACCCPWPACSCRWGSPSSSSRTPGAVCPSSRSAPYSPRSCVTDPRTPWAREGR
ncbi:hypothetical protein [Streptomyces sp. IBSBF 2390]|uniref:hypothetical protein n=1 Tax=Streptomyces sp. IBSBF 2390 TaxID=2903533 RepID=UPI002FDC04EA